MSESSLRLRARTIALGSSANIALRASLLVNAVARPVRHHEPIGPVQFGESKVLIRTPEPRDASSWRATRLANSKALRAVFDDGDRQWEAIHTNLDWLERCTRLRREARRGHAVPFVLVRLNDAGDEQIVGEVGVDGYDSASGTGELSIWIVPIPRRGDIGLWALLSVILCAFEMERPMARLVAPAAVTNSHPRALIEALELEYRAHLRGLRYYDGQVVDHDLWSLDNNPETVARLRAKLGELEANQRSAGSGQVAQTSSST
ncbi:GNAT family N-acetyltransferase [Antrihabitans cavernicola]|uniref:GNAT family N-acetyltransferase n=1 Tax=Antrihabitans cavernicola TaxID=2495913 RepID=A0A5A7SI13_9NOCA|nr:GNAT family protein [Spelaeibacter cavernicola]KAA0023861.1 GNAT family N-acetyltransferase [Spelaeibacter cavernicola]